MFYEPLPTDPGTPLRPDTLYLADILEGMARLPAESVDLGFAAPPYNLDKQYTPWDDHRRDQEYIEWCNRWLAEYVRVLKPTGSLFVVNLPKWAIHHAAFLNQHLYLQHWIAWDALSEPRGRLMPAHDAILYYTKSPSGYMWNDDGATRPFPFGYCFRARCVRARDDTQRVPLTDLWHDIHRIKHRRDRDAHPCQLPLALLNRIVRIASRPGDLVFDVGTGSTVVTARRLGRRYLGFDIDPHDLEITGRKLLSAATPTPPGRRRGSRGSRP